MSYENKEMKDFIQQAEAMCEMLKHRQVSHATTFVAGQLLDSYNAGFDDAVILIGKQTKKLGE